MGFVKFVFYLIVIVISFGNRLSTIDPNYLWLGLCVLASGAIAYSEVRH